MQFLDMGAVACNSEYQDFTKAKKRIWDSVSLMGQCKSEGKDFKRN
jgi:hypothetical protein